VKVKLFYSSYCNLFLKLVQLTKVNLNTMEFFLTIFIALFFTLLLSAGFLLFNKELKGSCADTGEACLCSDQTKKECEKLIGNKV